MSFEDNKFVSRLFLSRYSSPQHNWLVKDMGRKLCDSTDLDSLISPIYALTTVGGMGVDSAGWMGFKAVPVDDPPKPRTTMFLIDIGLSAKSIDAILHVLIICLVLFIVINCMCKFVWLFLK